jgi:predicted transcriptional regulator of viral defense system
VFRLADWVPELHDDLIRWTLWSKGRGVISHETAIAVYGIGEFESASVHLTVPVGFRMRDAAITLHFADLPSSDIVGHTGYRVTTVLRSLVDVAGGGMDADQLARAIHESIAGGHLTLRQLRARAEEIDLRAALQIERALQHAPTA